MTSPISPQPGPPRGLERILKPGWRSPQRRVEGKKGEVQRLLGEVLRKPDTGYLLARALGWTGVGIGLVWGAALAWEQLQRMLPIEPSAPLALFGPIMVAVLFAAWRFSRLTTPSYSQEELQQTVRARDPLRRVQADEQAQLLAHLNTIPGLQVGGDTLSWGVVRQRWAVSLERDGDPNPAAWVLLETDLEGDTLEIGLLHQEVGGASALQVLCQRPAVLALLQQLAIDADSARWQEQPDAANPDDAVIWLRLRLRDLGDARAAALERRSSENALPSTPVDVREDPAVAAATLAALLLRAGLGVDRTGAAKLTAKLHLRRAAPAQTPAQTPDAARWTLQRTGALPAPWEPPDPQQALLAERAASERQARRYGVGLLICLAVGLVGLIVLITPAGDWTTLERPLQIVALLLLGGIFLLEELALVSRKLNQLPRATSLGRAEEGATTLVWDGARHLSQGEVTLDLEAPFQLQLSRAPAADGADATRLGVTLLQRAPDGATQRLTLEVPGLALDDNAQQLPALELDAPQCPPELWTRTLGPLLSDALAAHGHAPTWSVQESHDASVPQQVTHLAHPR